MAISLTTIAPTQATVAAAGTSVSPLVAVPSNCHTIVILNRDATHDIYVAEGTAGAALNPNASTVLPAGASITLGVGVQSTRPSKATTLPLIFDAAGAGAIANITYVCGIQS